ncbi:UDP-glucuronosyltransferase 1-8 [Portunus trituberculatus]|uniref:UDP-glucuronosyltransferase 1-8 n=1 Tax=Portunus trituberculatus TaxID=210409 RepID=A0A5B7G0H1_PORTR|nr:UDP-glucuronosyltransferase 1-8 [Portunus trituberculatus]
MKCVTQQPSEAELHRSSYAAWAAGVGLLLILEARMACSRAESEPHQFSNATSSPDLDEGGGKRILVLHPMYAASHVLTLRSLARSLVARGHQVSRCTPEGVGGKEAMHLHGSKGKQKDRLLTYSLCWNEEKTVLLSPYTGIPAVGYWAFTFAGGEPQYTTAFSPPSSVPFILSHYRDSMTFKQRAVNHLHALGSHLVMQVHVKVSSNDEVVAENLMASVPSGEGNPKPAGRKAPVQLAITGYHISRHLPSCPSPATLLAEMSGMLINSHSVIDYPRLLPPSFINVGGLHIHRPNPLPKVSAAHAADLLSPARCGPAQPRLSV